MIEIAIALFGVASLGFSFFHYRMERAKRATS
jgi:hypothetical protein